MKLTCVYSLDDYASVEKPLTNLGQIPYGISSIAAILQREGHEVSLLVICPDSDLQALISENIRDTSPEMFALTAVSSQFPMIERVARVVKESDPSITIVLGGHHASLASEEAAASPDMDIICVGEGDRAVIECAAAIAEGRKPDGIANLWIKQEDGSLQKNANATFNEDLDTLPYIDRRLWEPWALYPNASASVLVGRGCPFRCTYCSNHAIQRLARGKFVRFRSPENLIGEIDMVSTQYPEMDHIYLEVETIGANPHVAKALYKELANYNTQREKPLTFSMNLALHSHFMKKEEVVREFLHYCEQANVISLNVGLESGSERIRRDILRRPRYTNDELARFCDMAKEYGIRITLFALMGVPDETPAEFAETVRAVRRIQPHTVYLSIFFPYPGTDLWDVTKKMGLIPETGVEVSAERSRATLTLPGFPAWRIRAEYIMFWARAFRGHWPTSKVISYMAKAYIQPHENLQRTYRFLVRSSGIAAKLKRRTIGSEKAYAQFGPVSEEPAAPRELRVDWAAQSSDVDYVGLPHS